MRGWSRSLFQEGLVRILFATETFAMGLNMPARAVVFTSMRKWDGETHRAPSASEYIQMSGRAGRRGLDSSGMVVLLLAEEMDPEEFSNMLAGEAKPLSSAFRLRYNTLLKLLAMETFEPERIAVEVGNKVDQSEAEPPTIFQVICFAMENRALRCP